MKKKTVTNLVVTTVATLGTGYVIQKYIKAKVNKEHYHPIANTYIKDGKCITKSIN